MNRYESITNSIKKRLLIHNINVEDSTIDHSKTNVEEGTFFVCLRLVSNKDLDLLKKSKKSFESLRMFREYGPDYRRPIMDKLEDSLVEIFDKWSIPESPEDDFFYSWWRDLNFQIMVGNIPDENQMYLILNDILRAKPMLEQRINREVEIENGTNSDSTCWISIEPK